MARKAKNIKLKVTEIEDNSVKVNIKHSPKMAEAVDALVELEEGSFRRVVKAAKSYRRANKLTSKLFGAHEVHLTVLGTDSSFKIINLLISLGGEEFKKTISCARKYRRADKMLNVAISNYKALKDEDAESLSQKMGLIYA